MENKKENMLRFLLNNCTDENEHLRAIIIARKKDTGKDQKIVKRYTFKNFNDYLKYKDDIIENMKFSEGRLYINPTVKSFEHIAYDLLEDTVKTMRLKNYEYLKRSYDSVADRNIGVGGKKIWVVDIDIEPGKSLSEKDTVSMKNIYSDHLLWTNKTKNGYHLLVKPHQINNEVNLLYGFDQIQEVRVMKNSLTEVFSNYTEITKE